VVTIIKQICSQIIYLFIYLKIYTHTNKADLFYLFENLSEINIFIPHKKAIIN